MARRRDPKAEDRAPMRTPGAFDTAHPGDLAGSVGRDSLDLDDYQSFAHRSPTDPGSGGTGPHESHEQNGALRYPMARLPAGAIVLKRVSMQVKWADSADRSEPSQA